MLGVVAMVGLLAVGGGYAAAAKDGKKDSAKCEETFKRWDSGSKGYLDQRDFDMAYHPPGVHKGSPVGTTKNVTAFAEKDANKDGRVTLEEFCR